MEGNNHTADPALAARIEALRPSLDLMQLPACVVDPERRYRYVNAAYAAFAGLPVDAFFGNRPSEIFTFQPSDGRSAALGRALAGETAIYDRETLEGPNAGRWVRAHYLPVQDDGRVIGALIMLVDIQSLKDTEQALAERERHLSIITDAVGFPISYVDGDGIVRFVNRPACEWIGSAPAQILGRPLAELAGEEVMRAMQPMLEKAYRGEKVVYEREATWPGGEKRRIRGNMIPDRDASGRNRGFLSVVFDIEEDHRLKEELLQRTRQLELVHENVGVPMSYVDADLRFRYTNQPGLDWRPGLNHDNVVGMRLEDVYSAESMAVIRPNLERALAGEKVIYEREATTADGTKRWIRVHVVPDFGPGGKVRGIYTIVIDIDDDRRLREELRVRGEQLRFFAENIPESIAYIDLERGCTFVNNHFLATRGFTREFVLGKFPEEVYPAELMEILTPHFETVMRGEEARYERLLRMPSGEERWIRMRLSPHKDATGRMRGYYVISTDIHEIRAAQAAVEDKERQLRQVIDSIPTPMVYCDAESRYRYVNDAFLDYIGLPSAQVIGRTVRELLGDERWAVLQPSLERVRAGESLAVERLIRFADGRSRWMNVRLSPRLDADGRYLGHYATTSDIHDQKMVEDELRRANSILSAHFDNTPLGVIEWDTGLRVVRWSGQAESIFGWPASEVLGRPLAGWRFTYEEDLEAVSMQVRRLVDGPDPHGTIVSRNYRKDGSVIWVEWHHSALRDEAGRVISLLSLAQDVSSRIQAEERLQYMATHDGLTGLPNRVVLGDRLESALARARRSRHRAAVMFLDLDRFKDVNDTLGHRVGDQLLKELARRLRATLRQSDLLARISGDEFVMVLENVPGEEAPDRVAAKVLDEARRAFAIDGHEIFISASLGVALFPEDGDDAETLLKNADAAMYAAKELGRNNFRLYSSELAARRARRLEIETALRRALKANELQLHFQPILNLKTGAVTRAEALLRWHDPERGLVMPGAFIPMAEESGLGHDVGNWVLESACTQARAWRDAGLGNVTMCVNLSAGQVRDSTMIADLTRILKRTGCEPSWLEFEITETSMVRDLEGVSHTLAKLRLLGIRVAIDDFGTGFSSLSHLRHLPIDVLKIDKGFVADIEAGPTGRVKAATGGAAIVSAVIGLAEGLGLDVVAEGIEKKSQLAFLTRAGCSAGQGYLLCPPLPPPEFEKWLRSRKKKKRTTKK